MKQKTVFIPRQTQYSQSFFISNIFYVFLFDVDCQMHTNILRVKRIKLLKSLDFSVYLVLLLKDSQRN